MLELTNKQMEIVEDNLRAYKSNFDYISIKKEDYGSGLYVYTDKEREKSGSWTQYCYNVDYLNGWLYGCVQAINGIMKPKDIDMYRAKFGFEFNTMEKVEEFNNGASICFGGCKSKEDVSDEYCHKCKLINECIQYYQDMEE